MLPPTVVESDVTELPPRELRLTMNVLGTHTAVKVTGVPDPKV